MQYTANQINSVSYGCLIRVHPWSYTVPIVKTAGANGQPVVMITEDFMTVRTALVERFGKWDSASGFQAQERIDDMAVHTTDLMAALSVRNAFNLQQSNTRPTTTYRALDPVAYGSGEEGAQQTVLPQC